VIARGRTRRLGSAAMPRSETGNPVGIPWHPNLAGDCFSAKMYSVAPKFAKPPNTGAKDIFNENAFRRTARHVSPRSPRRSVVMTFQPVPPKRVGPMHGAPSRDVKNALASAPVILPECEMPKDALLRRSAGSYGLEKGARTPAAMLPLRGVFKSTRDFPMPHTYEQSGARTGRALIGQYY